MNENEQSDILIAIGHKLPSNERWTNRAVFVNALDGVLKQSGIKIGAPIKKAILSSLSERDEDAVVCKDSKSKVEADSDLRDHELVPLGEDWHEYVEREVLPFVPDAWVDANYTDDRDGQIGRVGYEINFNRYFYKYVPPRPLEEIDAELKTLEAEIAGLLKEVVE